jgi:hypothetical protein
MPALILAGVPLDLSAPLKVSERWAPSHAMRPGCELLVMAAALGLCAPALRRQVPFQYDVLAFGAAIIDFLTADERRQSVKLPDGTIREVYPAQMAEIISAGSTALKLCMSSLVDVEGIAGFSPPPAGSPTAGGPSSEGGSTPVN